MSSPEESLPELKKAAERKKGLWPTLLWSGAFVSGLVALFAALSWAFGWVAVERYAPSELYDKYLSSRPESRSLILVEWMRMIAQDSRNAELLPTPGQVQRLSSDLENLSWQESGDRSLAAPLISLLGFSSTPEATLEVLLRNAEKIPAHQGSEAQIALLFAMGRLGLWNERVETYLTESRQDGEASIRKTLAYVLGSAPAWPRDRCLKLLWELSQDESEDTRWNAAISLYRIAAPEADALVQTLLDRVWTEEFQKRPLTLVDENLYRQLFASLRARPQKDFQKQLEKISQSHPHVTMRRLALEARHDSENT